MRKSDMTILLTLTAVILIASAHVAQQQVNAHVAVDEVPKWEGAGFDTDQLTHQHPHNRTIWYYPQNDTYAGSPVDIYEQTLIGDYVAPEPEPEPEPEPVPTEENFTSDRFVVMFQVDDATADCADGTDAEGVDMYHINTSPQFGDSRHGTGIIYSSGPDQLTTLANLRNTSTSSTQAAIVYIIEGQIDKDRDIARISGIVDHDDNYDMCGDANEFFAFDIEINCDGSGLEFTSRNDDGYSVSATDEQTHAVCYY